QFSSAIRNMSGARQPDGIAPMCRAGDAPMSTWRILTISTVALSRSHGADLAMRVRLMMVGERKVRSNDQPAGYNIWRPRGLNKIADGTFVLTLRRPPQVRLNGCPRASTT